MTLCPVCKHEASHSRRLGRDYIIAALEKYYGISIPGDLGIIDYDMMTCPKCSLCFANPMRPGSEKFYKWITTEPSYFTKKRWEWDAVADLIPSVSRGSLLEIGCGSGHFLDMMAKNTVLQVAGIDISETSVSYCRAQGLAVQKATVNEFRAANGTKPLHDHIVAFHCLEHLADPLDFLHQLRSLLKPDGRLFLSTPLSPMSLESNWYDPLNHPPHHLTRWNTASLEALALASQFRAEFLLPKAQNLMQRALASTSVAYSCHGCRHASGMQKIMLAAANPIKFVNELSCQARRDRINGRIAPDSVLMILTPET